jgi:predicted amidophosphoribosyltransferase
VVFGISNYSLGQKYCRRCEVYMYNDGMFCPCCGMQLRLTPSSRRCKEILRKRKDNTMKFNGSSLELDFVSKNSLQ